MGNSSSLPHLPKLVAAGCSLAPGLMTSPFCYSFFHLEVSPQGLSALPGTIIVCLKGASQMISARCLEHQFDSVLMSVCHLSVSLPTCLPACLSIYLHTCTFIYLKFILLLWLSTFLINSLIQNPMAIANHSLDHTAHLLIPMGRKEGCGPLC